MKNPGKTTIQWIYFPRSKAPDVLTLNVVEAFRSAAKMEDLGAGQLNSNAVLARVAPGLLELGFRVEIGKKMSDKIPVPVLFGLNGKQEKSFDVDAYHPERGFVLEVEAGRGVLNNQFLKDFFQACVMSDVRIFAVAVRNLYINSKDFEMVVKFFDTLYASNRLILPLEGILVIGY